MIDLRTAQTLLAFRCLLASCGGAACGRCAHTADSFLHSYKTHLLLLAHACNFMPLFVVSSRGTSQKAISGQAQFFAKQGRNLCWSLSRLGLVALWLLLDCIHCGKASEVAAGLGIAGCPGRESPLRKAASLLEQSPTEPRNDVPTGGSAVLKPCTCRDVASSTVVVVTVVVVVVVVAAVICSCWGLRLAIAVAGILEHLLLVVLVLSFCCCCSCSCC